MRKKIGITLRIVKEQNYDEIRDALSHDWVPFLEQIDACLFPRGNVIRNKNL